MYRPRQQAPAPRRGIVLLVVLALLTLFAIIGISFVLYANSEAKTSQYFRESEAPPQPDMDPELLLSMFLGQVIYDVDDTTGIYSGLRGHSLARTMYGFDGPPAGSDRYPFNGTGRLRGVPVPPTITDAPPQGPDKTAMGSPPFDEYYLVNYTFYPQDKFLRDPERPGFRTGPTAPQKPFMGGFDAPYTYPDLNNMFLAAVKAGPLELPTLNPKVAPGSAGAVLVQSFHRPWLFNWGYDRTSNTYKEYSLDNQNNPNWTNIVGKYLTLRPREFDQRLDPRVKSAFPYPEDAGGDVKNLINSPGYFVGVQGGKPVFANNDSIWMDLGAPVMTAPDGTKFKPLFAPLIIDLDNRINVNVHGNVRGNTRAANALHASNQGWGPWEVSLAQILNFGTPQPLNEWANLFTDLYSGTTPIENGRYAGPAPLSTYPAANTADDGTPPHFWNPVDFDASDELLGGGPSDPLISPTTSIGSLGYAVQNPPGNGPWYCPSFPATPKGYGNGSQAERQNHPLVYNFFNPYQDPSNASRRNLVFPISNMEALLRYGETNSPGLTSSLFRLCAANFSDPANGAKRRGLLTTHSFGLDRPGVSPWWWYNNDPKSILSMVEYDPTSIASLAPPLPTSNQVPFPPLNTPAKQLQTDFFTTGGGANLQTDWRALSAVLNKLDLNRRLTPYPIAPARLGPFDPKNNPVVPFPGNVNNRQYQQATAERIQFAQDILQRFMVATRAYDPQHPPVDSNGKKVQATPDQIRAVAYLAQLAVNIVDFIDSDDIMTGLDWLSYVDPNNTEFTKAANKLGYSGKGQYVWGVELPRVLLNEVYAEYTLKPGEDATHNDATYTVDVWVELYNALNDQNFNPSGAFDTESADPTKGYAYLRLPNANEGAYRLKLVNPLRVDPAKDIHLSTNPTGDPDQTALFTSSSSGQPCQVNQFKPTGAGNVPIQDFIAPAGGLFNGQNGGNLGFYVLGAQRPFPHEGQDRDVYPFVPTATHTDPLMSYQSRKQDRTAQGGTLYPRPDSNLQVAPTIVLQRLANPYLPWNDLTNPYITIDFMEGVLPNNGMTQAEDMATYTPVEKRAAWEKRDPFNSLKAGAGAPNAFAKLPVTATDPKALRPLNQHQPQHTLFRHNGVDNKFPGPNGPSNLGAGTDAFLALPFTWLPHPDRQLISPMELLTVPGYKAAEITQRFPLQGGTPLTNNKHFAPWFIYRNNNNNPDTTRLFRFFEFVETNNRATGVARGGRIPGLVNLNTVWDPEILMALCDPQPGNNSGNPAFFTATDIYRSLVPGMGGGENINTPTSSFWRMMKSRSPSLVSGQGADYLYQDRPFLGHAPPVTPGGPNDVQHPLGGTGFNDTLFRADQVGKAPIFLPSSYNGPGGNPIHPYIGSQLMTKLFNNVTTRSNVFAVWVTVGFFQVVQDTDANGQPIRPVKLGAEIGKAEGRNIRHRMFAIVDRSNLTIDIPGNQTGPPVFLEAKLETNTIVPIKGVRTEVPVYSISGAQYNAGNAPSLSGSYEGIAWKVNTNADRWLQTEPLVGLRTNQIQDQFRKVIAVNPPGTTFVNPLGQRVKVDSPTITLEGLLGAGTSSPLYLMPLGKTATPFRLGNPGPKPGFNMRNYPWIVRYFSIIH